MSLLMGNGFSMAYDKEIFSYNALYNFLQSQDDELLTKLFGAIKTKNFELVMQQLDTTIALLDAFGAEKSVKQQILEASEKLKQGLLKSVKECKPPANPPCFSGRGIWQPAMRQQFADPTVGLSR